MIGETDYQTTGCRIVRDETPNETTFKIEKLHRTMYSNLGKSLLERGEKKSSKHCKYLRSLFVNHDKQESFRYIQANVPAS